MVDRFGNRIVVGWPEYQTLWLRAAMSLEPGEMRDAFRDIAALTGRSYGAVLRMRYVLGQIDKQARRRAKLTAASRRYLAEQIAAE